MQCQLHSGHDSAVCVMQEISLLPQPLMQEKMQVQENQDRQEMGRKVRQERRLSGEPVKGKLRRGKYRRGKAGRGDSLA